MTRQPQALERGGTTRRRLTLDPHVLIGAAALVALLAGAVAVALVRIVGLEGETTDLADRQVRYATSIHAAALNAKGIANNERGFLISGRAEFLDDMEARIDEAHAAFAAAHRYAAGAPEEAAAAEARAGFRRWLAALRREVAVYRAGSRRRAIRTSLGPTRELRLAYERSLARAEALGLRSIEAASSSVSDSASRSVTLLLAYLAAALLAGVGVALWVIRIILKPTHELTRNALEVLTRARVLVEEGPHGSHHSVKVEVPIEVVNALAESALDAQEGVRGGSRPAA